MKAAIEKKDLEEEAGFSFRVLLISNSIHKHILKLFISNKFSLMVKVSRISYESFLQSL